MLKSSSFKFLSLSLSVYACTPPADNQKLMAQEGAIECLIALLESESELIQRQSAKALANLGVNGDNKPRIAAAGGIPKLVALAATEVVSVRIEAVAALANLAVNGECCGGFTNAAEWGWGRGKRDPLSHASLTASHRIP